MKWETKAVSDFVSFQRGFDLPREKFVDGDYPVIGSTSILGHHIEAKVEGPGVVTGRSGTLGLFQYIKTDFWPHNTTLWVKDFKGNDKLFAYYALSTLDFIALNGGGAVPTLNRNFLDSISLKVPPLPIQQKIASILSAYDDLIENNLKRVKLIEEDLSIQYKLLVIQCKEFIKYKIEDICQTFGGGTPSTNNHQYWEDGDITWFSPTDLTKHNSFVLLDSDKKITNLGLSKSSAKIVPPMTILMTSRATIGYFGLISKPASTNQGFINIIPNRDHYRAYILFNLMNRKDDIINNANGATYLEITKGNFRKMSISIPTDESVLKDFEYTFHQTFRLIENLLKQNNLLQEARDILLPRLMSGEIEV